MGDAMENAKLVRYDAMVLAIAECHRVDEIKQIHDQAAALEAAAKVAMNTEAERKAIEIRVRAERRAGELMKAMQRDSAEQRGKKRHMDAEPAAAAASEYRRTLNEVGIPERTAQRWQELAEVPKDRFEAHLTSEANPSSRAIIDSAKAKPRMSEEALWLWGRMREFERRGMLDIDPDPLIDELTDAMREDVYRLAPLIAAFFHRCVEREIV